MHNSAAATNGNNSSNSSSSSGAHPRLWKLIAETALEQLDLSMAEKAFVACSNYAGIQFIKKLNSLNDRVKQRAEVSAYFQRYCRMYFMHYKSICML
jgi:hypothetical protein